MYIFVCISKIQNSNFTEKKWFDVRSFGHFKMKAAKKNIIEKFGKSKMVTKVIDNITKMAIVFVSLQILSIRIPKYTFLNS